MVDGVVLLVDAAEGPLPQTRFVLRKTLASKLPVVLVINKVDRSDARIAEVVDETYELFLDLLDSPEDSAEALDFPIVYASARAGRASLERPADGSLPAEADLRPLFATILATIPAPVYDDSAPLQAHVTNLDASPYLGRIALCRVHNGTIAKGQTVAWCRTDGTVERVKVSELFTTRALERVPTESAGPGDIIAIAGIADITIGETLADINDPRPLPLITVDEPSISMTVGINTSPLAGQSGTKLTARLVKNRLDAELVGNVSLRVLTTNRPDTWEVQGRGELQLAVLVELMRREGFELTVGKPQVVTRIIDGRVHEPVERLTVDVPEVVRRRGHPTAWPTAIHVDSAGQPRQRLGSHGIPGAVSRPDRIPYRVPDRNPRYRPPASRIRWIRALGGRAAHPSDRLVGRRSGGCRDALRAVQPAGARHAVRRADDPGL